MTETPLKPRFGAFEVPADGKLNGIAECPYCGKGFAYHALMIPKPPATPATTIIPAMPGLRAERGGLRRPRLRWLHHEGVRGPVHARQ
jgi:hypothetical protein